MFGPSVQLEETVVSRREPGLTDQMGDISEPVHRMDIDPVVDRGVPPPITACATLTSHPTPAPTTNGEGAVETEARTSVNLFCGLFRQLQGPILQGMPQSDQAEQPAKRPGWPHAPASVKLHGRPTSPW